ncbi:FadR/GntR family transcriptional regulator [Leucobacter sp. HNU]|uniref:FadR/GntR family transcriptional regulator n=1 Tax=Leucobacter sp. HNU TaxID=3236805 RepID=UPI003A7FA770
MNETFEQRTRAENLRDRLLTAVLIGEYLPGSRLPSERELADSLDVARETMRQALRMVTEAGLLEVRRGRGGGYFVTAARIDERSAAAQLLHRRLAEIEDAIDAGSRIQGAICEAAAERRTADDVRILEARLADFVAAASGREKQAADSRLHLAISDAAHIPALADAMLFLDRRVSLSAPQHPWGAIEDQAAMEERATRDHTELVRLIVAGEIAAAGALARRHAMIDRDLIEQARRRAEATAVDLRGR